VSDETQERTKRPRRPQTPSRLTVGALTGAGGASWWGLSELLAVLPDEAGPAGTALLVVGYLAWATIGKPIVDELRHVGDVLDDWEESQERTEAQFSKLAQSIEQAVEDREEQIEELSRRVDSVEKWIEELRKRAHRDAGDIRLLLASSDVGHLKMMAERGDTAAREKFFALIEAAADTEDESLKRSLHLLVERMFPDGPPRELRGG